MISIHLRDPLHLERMDRSMFIRVALFLFLCSFLITSNRFQTVSAASAAKKKKRKKKRHDEREENAEGTCEGSRRGKKDRGRCLLSGKDRGLEGLALDICSWQEMSDRCIPSLHVFDNDAAEPLDATTYFQYVRAGLPFVVRGTVEEEKHGWATRKESLVKAFGRDFVARVNILPDGYMGYAYFDEMIHKSGETSFYAPQTSCDEILDTKARASLRPSGLPATVFGERSDACNLWIGARLDESKHGHTLLHIDHTHNVYAQLAGTKTFVLLPPHAREALVPFRHINGVMMSEARVRGVKWINGAVIEGNPRLYRFEEGARFTHFGSHLDLAEHDGTTKKLDMYHNFPNIRNRRHTKREKVVVTDTFLEKHGMRVTLEPGDTLYLPPYWYHEVQSFGDLSVSYNHWWNSAGWMRRIMKKLDNVASAMFQMPAPWIPPGPHLKIAEVLPPTAYPRMCDGERSGDWPCVPRRAPGNPDAANLQSQLRTACIHAHDCAVTDMHELLLETPTWKQAFARANPSYREGMEQAGVLKDWSRVLS